MTQTKPLHPMCISCPLCIASFNSFVALQAHCVYSHRVGFHTCAWCAVIIETESKIGEHAKVCTELATCEEDDFEAFSIVDKHCNVCESMFPSNERAIKHYKEIHLRCTYICCFCTKYFCKKENFVKHCADEHPHESQSATMDASQMEKSISERTTRDKLQLTKHFNEKRCCNIDFENIAEITQHFRDKHQIEMHVCLKCEKGYTLKTTLDHHPCIGKKRAKMSRGSRPYKKKLTQDFNAKRCSRCELLFKNSAESSKHFLVKHGYKVLVCTKCDHGWLSVKNLKYHKCCPPSPIKSVKEPPQKKNAVLETSPKLPSTAKRTTSSKRKFEVPIADVGPPSPIKSVKENQPSPKENAVEQEAESVPMVLSISCSAINEIDLTSTLSKPNGNKTITDFFPLTTKRNLNESTRNKVCKCPKTTVKNPSSMQEIEDDKENVLEKSITHSDQTNIHIKIPFSKCSTPKSPRARNKDKSKKTVITPAIHEATHITQSFCLSDSETKDTDVEADADEDIEILEWNPGTDVKPVIKLEMEWN